MSTNGHTYTHNCTQTHIHARADIGRARFICMTGTTLRWRSATPGRARDGENWQCCVEESVEKMRVSVLRGWQCAWDRTCYQLLRSGVTSGRRVRLVTPVLLVCAIFLLVTAWTGKLASTRLSGSSLNNHATFSSRPSTTKCDKQAVPNTARALPEETSSEEQIRRDLAHFLNKRGLSTCRKLLRMGGETVMLGTDNTTLAGDHMVCVDNGHQMAAPQCLVHVLATCQDNSFVTAAEQFGCEVQLAKRRQCQHTTHTPPLVRHDQAPVGYLAVGRGAGGLGAVLDEGGPVSPSLTCHRVQQLGVVIELPASVDEQVAEWAVRLLYRHLRQLQMCRFLLFDVEDVEIDGAVSVSLYPQAPPVNSVLRLSFLKPPDLCLQ